MSAHHALPAGDFGPPPSRADILIIGAGIMGLATAYQAARLGAKRIVVLDAGHLCGGASGRNGGGIRMQWSSEENIAMMQESVSLCRNFAADLGVNIWFRQGGYLFLVKDEAHLPVLKDNVALQNRCGVPTRMLSQKEIKKLVPELNTTGVLGASYNPKDGVLFPWPFIYGYAQGAIDKGVRIHTHARVTSMETADNKVTDVHVEGDFGEGYSQTIQTEWVVNAAGAWAPMLVAPLGLTLPNVPVRHEICTSEPLKPFLKPMVTVLGQGIYFSQAMRGELVGGMGDPNEPSSFSNDASFSFLQRYAEAATRLIPELGNVKIARQWAGSYDASPDGRPIVGESKVLTNMSLLTGFTGHGFMMAPAVGKLMAERLVLGKSHAFFNDNGPDRFEHGIAENSETMIIG